MRRTRAGRTRRSAVRATSAAASRAAGRSASACRRARAVGAWARGTALRYAWPRSWFELREHACERTAQVACMLVVERAAGLVQQAPKEQHAARGHGAAVEHPRLELLQQLAMPTRDVAPQR